MNRRNRDELNDLVLHLIEYLSYTNAQGKHLPFRDLAKLLGISKSRVGQLIEQLPLRYSHLKDDTDNIPKEHP